MKILFIDISMHKKNLDALLNYNINISRINHTNLDTIDLSQFDCVYSPAVPINISKYPNTKFLFGPHFSVFPQNHQMTIICGNNVIYIQPSKWVVDLWKNFSICSDLNLQHLPFGVDTKKFSPIKNISDRDKIFIYHKRRNPQDLIILQTFLKSLNINFRIFDYVNKYPEEEYINYLKDSKFGIWLSAHESQGFALEEALSCDVPLLVWNVTSLNQEYRSNYPDKPATTIPYWDDRCGESFTEFNELPSVFNTFIDNLQNYKPREYILENLSIKKCSEKFINIVNNI
jgi:hypothetical protein